MAHQAAHRESWAATLESNVVNFKKKMGRLGDWERSVKQRGHLFTPLSKSPQPSVKLTTLDFGVAAQYRQVPKQKPAPSVAEERVLAGISEGLNWESALHLRH
jgi:hypothetical protein